MKIIKQLLNIVLAFSLIFSMSIPSSAINIADQASPIESGVSYEKTFQYSHGWGDYEFSAYFSIKCTKAGTLYFRIKTPTSPSIYLYDSNGKTVKAESVESVTGTARVNTNSVYLMSSDAFGYYEGTISYYVEKGTYYIYYRDNEKSDNLDSNKRACVNFTATAPQGALTGNQEESVPEIECFELTLSEGDTIKAGAVWEEEIGTVKWTSSNSSIASVSSKGKITAKKKGTATITAKSATNKIELKIKVQ